MKLSRTPAADAPAGRHRPSRRPRAAPEPHVDPFPSAAAPATSAAPAGAGSPGPTLPSSAGGTPAVSAGRRHRVRLRGAHPGRPTRA